MPKIISTGSNKKDLGEKSKWKNSGFIGAVLVVIILAGLFSLFKFANLNGGANPTYQAVFLVNGQVYFGKMSQNKDWLTLSDVYYLQVNQTLQNTTGDNGENAVDGSSVLSSPSNTSAQNIQLVKLGSELHGPKDLMHIQNVNVLFWEDMKADSRVIQAIEQFKNSRNKTPKDIKAGGNNKF